MLDVHGHTRIDHWVRTVLRAGMVLSISVLVIGLLLFALNPSQSVESIPLGEIPREILNGNAIAVISLGILFLIATPLIRVVTALIVFSVDREPRFVATSLIVLVVLILAVLLKL